MNNLRHPDEVEGMWARWDASVNAVPTLALEASITLSRRALSCVSLTLVGLRYLEAPKLSLCASICRLIL